MERYLSLALLLALLLTTVNSTALAESEGINIDEAVFTESDISLSDALDLRDLDIVDVDLLNDLDADDSAQIIGEEDDSSDTAVQPNKSNPVLTASSITIGVKEKYTKLKVQMTASNGKSPKIKWRSANKKIAKVDSKTGKVTGVKKGKTTIYAKVKGYKKEIKCKVNVLKAPKKEKFSISPENGSLKVGQIGQYKIVFKDGYGGSFTFSSSDPEIASIDEKGLVTAVAPGTCKITVTMYNEVSRTVSLQVLGAGSSENEKIEKLLEYARSKLGCPYVGGKFGPNSFDCVGFTYWCYKQVGVKLKDRPEKQANDTQFMEVSYSELAPGDLVYFHSDENKTKASLAGIYLGDGEFIHASSKKEAVIISQMVSHDSDYYKRNFHCARRVFT